MGERFGAPGVLDLGGLRLDQRDDVVDHVGIVDLVIGDPPPVHHVAALSAAGKTALGGTRPAGAVAAATDDFLANATDEELNKEVDSPVGKQPFITFFANIALTHAAGHWGEIAALKGVQGLKGLPF